MIIFSFLYESQSVYFMKALCKSLLVYFWRRLSKGYSSFTCNARISYWFQPILIIEMDITVAWYKVARKGTWRGIWIVGNIVVGSPMPNHYPIFKTNHVFKVHTLNFKYLFKVWNYCQWINVIKKCICESSWFCLVIRLQNYLKLVYHNFILLSKCFFQIHLPLSCYF